MVAIENYALVINPYGQAMIQLVAPGTRTHWAFGFNVAAPHARDNDLKFSQDLISSQHSHPPNA
jgi:hypothetical protein